MILGHEKLLKTLTELSKYGELSHGLLFFGSEGVGKFFAAKCLANYLEHGELAEPTKLLQDSKIIEPDAEGKIGIGASREIREFLVQKPNISKYRTLIINNAEVMTEEAENALLKISEEPPESSLLILIVRDPELLSPTIRSRFQKIYFGELKVEEVEEWLKKELKVPAAEAKKLAKFSGGKPGLAYRALNDKDFTEEYKKAQKFLSAGPSARSALIKAYLEDEEFKPARFLDMLILALNSGYEKTKEFAGAWALLLELRRNLDYYNLNPRIQLEALAQKLVIDNKY